MSCIAYFCLLIRVASAKALGHMQILAKIVELIPSNQRFLWRLIMVSSVRFLF